MKDIIVNMIGIGGAAIAAYAALTLTKKAILESNKFLGGLTGPIGKIVQAAENRAKQSKSYQGRQMAKNQKQQERQRAATEAYASRVTDPGARGTFARWRAGGRSAAARNRAYVAGLGAVEKLESQETKDAEFVLKQAGIQVPDDLAQIALGGEVNGVQGKSSEALRRAAIRKVIAAQDAGALETMFKGGDAEFQSMLVKEVRDQYSTAKGAGAHFVKLDAKPGGYTQPELNTAAMEQLITLSAGKLAGQDGPAVKSAMAGYATASLAQQQKMWELIDEIYGDSTILGTVKGSARKEMDAFRAAVPTKP